MHTHNAEPWSSLNDCRDRTIDIGKPNFSTFWFVTSGIILMTVSQSLVNTFSDMLHLLDQKVLAKTLIVQTQRLIMY
jgi:hypothetical protein